MSQLGTTFQEAIDGQIDQERQSAPAPLAVKNQRTRKRLKVSEINQLDEDGVRAGMNPAYIGDDRSPAVRFLDLVDLPRNTVANHLFGESPSLAKTAGSVGVGGLLGGVAGGLIGGTAGFFGGAGVGLIPGAIAGATEGAAWGAGASAALNLGAAAVRPYVLSDADRRDIVHKARRGALNQPSIYFSDALEKMGVENKVARAVIGFGGDVLMDPLTYMSGGGNTVKWVSEGGQAIRVGRPFEKSLEDVAAHVARTGMLPTDTALKPFTALWQDTVRVGDKLIDVSGSGPQLRDRILEAVSEINKAPRPERFAHQRRQLLEVFKRDITSSMSLNEAAPELAARAAIARDMIRRYGAVSDQQFTFPLSGFIANRLRGPLAGRSLDIPIGRLGESGRLQQALRPTEEAFLADEAARVASQRASLTAERAKVASKTFEGVPVNPGRLKAIDTALEQLDVTNRAQAFHQASADLAKAELAHAEAIAEVKTASEGVDRAEALASPRLEAANLAVMAAESDLAKARKRAADLAGPARFESLAGNDRARGMMREGAAATATSGPYASLKAIDDRTGGVVRRHDELQIKASALRQEQGAMQEFLRAERHNAAKSLRAIAPGGVMETAAADAERAIRALDDASEGYLKAKQDILEAARGERMLDRVDIPVPRPSSDVGRLAASTVEHTYRIGKNGDAVAEAALEGHRVTENAGQINRVDVKMHPLDRLAWLATQPVDASNSVAQASKIQALAYLQTVVGQSKGGIRKWGADLRKRVKSTIEAGIPGKTAGTGAGSREGGRTLELAPSRIIAKREALSARILNARGKVRTAGGLFADLPRDVKNRLKFIDKALTNIELQKAALQDVAGKVTETADRLQRISDMIQSSSFTAEAILRLINSQIEQVKAGTFYGLMQKVRDAEDAVRTRLRLNPSIKPLDHMRRDYMALAPYRQELVMREYRGDIGRILQDVKGANSMDVSAALEVRIAQRAEANAAALGDKINAFPRHPITGEAMDDLVKYVDELSKTEEGRDLLKHPALDQYAEKYVARMEQDLLEQQSLGILPDFTPKHPYFHQMPTELAKDAVRSANERLNAGVKLSGTRKLSDSLPFTYRKVSYRYFYGDPNVPGQYRSIYAGELNHITPGDTSHPFEAWRQDYLRGHPELMQPGDLFDQSLAGGKKANEAAGIASGDRWLPDPFITSAMHMNNDRRAWLGGVGDAISGPIFEMDFGLRLSARALHGEQAKTFARFRNEILPMALPLTEEEAKALPVSVNNHVLSNGIEYKQFSQKALEGSAIKMPFDDEARRNFYPVALVNAVDDYVKRMTPAAMNPILKATDALTGWLRKTTLFHPSWFVGNMIGGAFNSWAAAETRPLMWAKHAKDYGDLVLELHGLKGFTPATDRLPVFWGDRMYTRGELKELFVTSGAANAGRSQIEALNNIRMGGPTSFAGEVAKKGSRFGEWLGKWYQANAASDDLWRVITLTERRLLGDDMEAAIERMVRAHFDYSDLSNWEQKIGKRVFFFYTWMRNNTALQAKILLDKPAISASFPKLKNALEEQFDSEQLVPDDMRPRWMRDNIAVQLTNRPNAKFALLSLFTPIQELIETGQATTGTEGLIELLKYTTTSVNPLIKAPFEFVGGKELFTGREIGDPDLGKTSPLAYLASEFRPWREVAGIARIKDQGNLTVSDVVRRFTVGGKVQSTKDSSLEGRLAYETGETTRLLKRQLQRARDAGDTDEAERLAIRTVALYRKLWDLGLFESVPRELRGAFRREAPTS